MFDKQNWRLLSYRLDRIELLLNAILTKETKTMSVIDDLVAAVAAEKTVSQSAMTLLTQLHDQLAAALATQDLTAVAAVVADLQSNTTALGAAVVANTPAAAAPAAAADPAAAPVDPGAAPTA